MDPIHVFIGYDAREHVAYKICEHSIVRRASKPVRITPLNHKALRKARYFDRPWRIDGDGQFWDERDGRPFSTEFAFTRFLVPFVAKENSLSGHVVFVDCDFLFQDDIVELIQEAHNQKGAVAVVKHDFTPTSKIKMDGKRQEAYSRKLWSSLIVWNMEHPATFHLSVNDVNYREGRWLHNFCWLGDHEISPLSERWNWLPNYSPTIDKKISPDRMGAIHYTEGGPWFENYRDVPYAAEWLLEQSHFVASLNRIDKDMVRI